MNYRLHHIGIRCSDLGVGRALFCGLFGHHELGSERFCGVEALRLGQAGTDLELALFTSPPRVDWLPSGSGIQYVAFVVERLTEALRHLLANGVEPLSGRLSSRSYDYAVVCSAEGLPVILLELVDDTPPREAGSGAENLHGFLLTHTGILTDDLAASERFWRGHFGLHRFSSNDRDGSGFMALADSHWQPGHHNAFLELLCPPNVLNVDQYGYDLAGIGYYHLSYYCADVEAAWRDLVDRGLFPTLPPYVEAGTGAEDAFVFAPDLVAIELFGGESVREVMATADIRELDETFSVDAAGMAAASGAMTPLPEGHRFGLVHN